MPTSSASATWEGGLKGGKGTFEGASGLIRGAYSFPTRFEGGKGTNPEELIASAHASCLSMALSAGLEKAGTMPTRITTSAAVTLDFVQGAPRITKIELTVRGVVPGITQEAFVKAAEDAKAGCPISNLFKGNAAIQMDAKLG